MSICIPIPPQITSPMLEVKVVQDLQNLFSPMSWLENAYALTKIGLEKTQEVTQFKYPQVYAGDTAKKAEYYDLRPNDNLKSYCFFEIDAPLEYDQTQEQANYFLSVVFWFNLAKISGRTYDYSSELVGHVLKILKESVYQAKISDIKVEKRPEEIFSKYSFNEQESQFLMYPYGAFKISFKVTDEADCNAIFTETNPNSCEQ